MLYQYNNIYISLHKYLKGKKKHTHTQNRLLEKKNVATVPLGTIATVQKKKVANQNGTVDEQ